MTEKAIITAFPWPTPFDIRDSDRIHLLRVDYPSCHWVSYPDGRHYDFADYYGPKLCEIWVFSEADETVYRVSADADTLRIHDERDLPQIDEWIDGGNGTTVRLRGSELHRSVSSLMNNEEPSYLILTGNDCVEFLCLNEPKIEAVAKLG